MNMIDQQLVLLKTRRTRGTAAKRKKWMIDFTLSIYFKKNFFSEEESSFDRSSPFSFIIFALSPFFSFPDLLTDRQKTLLTLKYKR